MNTKPPLQIAKPCPKSWDSMQGDAKRRFCEHCQLQVHNLSAMSEREREAMLEETGGKACIGYLLRPDGTMIISNWRTQFAGLFRRVGYTLAAVFPFAFSACKPQERWTGGVMCPPKGYQKGNDNSPILLGDMTPPEKPKEKNHPKQ